MSYLTISVRSDSRDHLGIIDAVIETTCISKTGHECVEYPMIQGFDR